jgi:hypothetical protein
MPAAACRTLSHRRERRRAGHILRRRFYGIIADRCRLMFAATFSAGDQRADGGNSATVTKRREKMTNKTTKGGSRSVLSADHKDVGSMTICLCLSPAELSRVSTNDFMRAPILLRVAAAG